MKYNFRNGDFQKTNFGILENKKGGGINCD